MINKTLEYKGFQGSVDFDLESSTLHGKILHINDLVTYEVEDIKELYPSFIEAVEDYLETCAALNIPPEKPFSGTFNVRIGEQLHKGLARFAARHGSSINEVVKEAISCHIDGRHNEIHHHHYPQQTYEASDFIPRSKGERRTMLRVVS